MQNIFKIILLSCFMLAENIMDIFQTLENQNENFLDVCTEELIVYGMNIEDKSLWYFFIFALIKKIRILYYFVCMCCTHCVSFYFLLDPHYII